MFTWKSHAGLKLHFGQNDRYEIHIVLSFISPQFMWTQVKSWLNTEVRYSTEMKSHTGLSSFRLSCERTLIRNATNNYQSKINQTVFPTKTQITVNQGNNFFLHFFSMKNVCTSKSRLETIVPVSLGNNWEQLHHCHLRKWCQCNFWTIVPV